MNRRAFLKYSSSLALVLANGNILQADELNTRWWKSRKVKLRFVIASDGHYGEKNTPYEAYYETLVQRINEEHAMNPFAFCMINGDIVHDDKTHDVFYSSILFYLGLNLVIKVTPVKGGNENIRIA